MQITGSILQPNISGNIKLSHGEAYLPHDKGSGAAPLNTLATKQSRLSGSGGGGINRMVASRYVSRFFSSEPASSKIRFPQPSGAHCFFKLSVHFYSRERALIGWCFCVWCSEIR